MYYVCHNTHILVKGKMKKDEKNEGKKRMNPWFYAIFWLSRQKLARDGCCGAFDVGIPELNRIASEGRALDAAIQTLPTKNRVPKFRAGLIKHMIRCIGSR